LGLDFGFRFWVEVLGLGLVSGHTTRTLH